MPLLLRVGAMAASTNDRVGTNALLSMIGDWSVGGAGPLHRRLADAIRQAAETGVLPPGSVLPAERALARALIVSRSTVTAALNDLKADGVLEARQGSGTRVVGRPPEGPPGATVLPGILSVPSRSEPGVIDLAASTPADARALPTVDVDLDSLLRAGPRHGYTPEGLPALRDAVAERLTLGGLPTSLDEVLITNGAQHGLALAFTMLSSENDPILVDEPTYPGMIDLLASRGLQAIGLPRRAGGIDVAALRRLVDKHAIRVAYLQTSVHNPTGLIADDWEFRALAKTCDDLDLTVIEDMVLADLRYDGSEPAPIAARVRKANVLAIGSISKLGWGGLRIGWMRASASAMERLVRTRLTDDLGSSIPSQVIAAGVLANFDRVAGLRRTTLAERAALAQTTIAEAVPEWSVHPPAGGLSLWVQLHHPVAEQLSQEAIRAGVTVATGVSASVDASYADHIRLCFDRPEAQLVEGLRRLAVAWRSLDLEPERQAKS